MQILDAETPDTSEAEAKLLEAKKYLDDTSAYLAKIVELRAKKAAIEQQEQQISPLVDLLKNTKQIIGQKYFYSLLEGHEKKLQTLLDSTSVEDPLRKKLEQSMKNLKEQSLMTDTWLYAMSTVFSPLISLYRWATPETIQQAVSENIQTWDSVCKETLQQLTAQQLTSLGQQKKVIELELEALSTKLSAGHTGLKKLIEEESSENLQQIVTANQTAKGALDSYIETASSVKDQREKLMQFKETNEQLTQFIEQNDGFFVALSNLFSKIHPIFKSQTAQMIDLSRELKEQIDDFSKVCANATEANLEDMEKASGLTKDVKDSLTKKYTEIKKKTSASREPLTKDTFKTFLNETTQFLSTAKSTIGDTGVLENEEDEEIEAHQLDSNL
ncbi:MAG: hypothetical protein ACRCXC_05290 [Legionella sp.]